MAVRISTQRIQSADVLFLESRLSPFLRRALHGFEVVELNLNHPTLYLRPGFLIAIARHLRRASRLAAWIAAVVECTGSKVLVGMDNFDLNQHTAGGETLFEELGRLLPAVSILSIQHGQELRRFSAGRPKKRVTLLCWGSWVADRYPQFGRNEQSYVPVGPLVDGLYRAIRPKHIIKDVDLCFVSTVKGPEWWGSVIGERQSGFEILASYLRRYSNRHSLIPHIALTIDRDQNGEDEYPHERQWFLDRLGENIRFTEPKLIFGTSDASDASHRSPEYVKERYSTYYLCDRSEVTLGMTSSVLWESFGRGNKVLAVNCTNNEAYDFPIPGPWSMRQPSYSEFEARLREIQTMSDADWQKVSREARLYLIHQDSQTSPHDAINREIRRALEVSRPYKSHHYRGSKPF
jgi:hypothetical protein